MSEEYGSDFITITDEEGNNFELELLDENPDLDELLLLDPPEKELLVPWEAPL